MACLHFQHGGLEEHNSAWILSMIWQYFSKERLCMAEEDDKKLPVYKVALCGKSDVGKTSIFRRVRGDGFLDDTSKFKHLAEDTIKVRVKDKTVKVRNI